MLSITRPCFEVENNKVRRYTFGNGVSGCERGVSGPKKITERQANKRQPLSCAAVTSVQDGRGLGRAAAGIEPVPIRRKIRRAQTGAVSLGRRARSGGRRAGRCRRQGAAIGHRRDPTSGSNGVPSVGDPIASVGMDRFRARLPDTARQQDRGQNRAAWSTRASRVGRVAASGGQPLCSARRQERTPARASLMSGPLRTPFGTHQLHGQATHARMRLRRHQLSSGQLWATTSAFLISGQAELPGQHVKRLNHFSVSSSLRRKRPEPRSASLCSSRPQLRLW